MFVRRETVAITTSAGGAATAYTGVINGRILSIKYTKTDFDNGSTFTIKTKDTQQNVWVQTGVNATAQVAPRQATHDTVGVASLYAAGGEPVEDYVYAAGERIEIVIAGGGNVKSGTFDVLYG